MRRMAHLYHLTIVFISCTCIVCVRVYRALNLFSFLFFSSFFINKYKIYLKPYRNDESSAFSDIFGCDWFRMCSLFMQFTQYAIYPYFNGKRHSMALHTFQCCLFVVFGFFGLFSTILLFLTVKFKCSNRKHSSYLPYSVGVLFLISYIVSYVPTMNRLYIRSAFISFVIFYI